MGRPRHITPGTTYFITRRCAQRTFRLRPSALSSQIFLYALALAAEKTGVAVHAVCVMSDHHHTVVTDTYGRLPEFLAELHRTTAKVFNTVQGHWEAFWSSEPCHAVIIVDDDALVDRIAYTVANPVAAGLVARPEDWPGVTLWEPSEINVSRPRAYFDPNGKTPEVASIRIVHPACRATARTEWKARVAHRIWLRVLTAHRKLRRAGRRFLGRAAVLAESTTKRAVSFERKRLFAAPVASSRPATLWRAVHALRAFRVAYRDARARWRDGDRDVQFPLGTWGMMREHGVALATGECSALRIAA